jgi:hypothetical protein
MRCVAFRRLERGSLQGFADLAMDRGLVVLSCTLHQTNGKCWANPPSRPQLDGERKLVIYAGKIAYAPVIDFVDTKRRFRWSAEAVKAIDAFANSKAPADAGAMSNDEGKPERKATPDG